MKYYYNDKFCSGVLYLQSKAVESKDVASINFYIGAPDRPIIYTYLPNESARDSDKIQSLISEWEEYEKVYEAHIDDLSVEEFSANRGDYIVAEGAIQIVALYPYLSVWITN